MYFVKFEISARPRNVQIYEMREFEFESLDNNAADMIRRYLDNLASQGGIINKDMYDEAIEGLIPYFDSPYHGKTYKPIAFKSVGFASIKVSLKAQ